VLCHEYPAPQAVLHACIPLLLCLHSTLLTPAPPLAASQVRVQCPEMEGGKLIGQMLVVDVVSLSDTVGALKARLAEVLDLAANKQKLARDGVGFLKDEFTLAYYNASPDVVLTLGLKERGGKRKI
jgi:splicing factor 3A subunit 1